MRSIKWIISNIELRLNTIKFLKDQRNEFILFQEMRSSEFSIGPAVED